MAIIYNFKNSRNGFLRSVVRSLALSALVLLAFLAVHSESLVQAQQRPRPLYIMNADGTDLRLLVQLQDHECMGAPMWMRDGKQILFDAWRKKESFNTSHIYIVNADGTWPVDLGPGAMPSGLANTKKSLGLATHYYGDQQGVWLGVKEPALVDPDAGSPRWHPYESKLAYLKWGGGIMMREISDLRIGKEEVLVPASHRPYVGFSWSPDGKAIAFFSNRNGDKNAELLVMNITDKDNEPEVKATGKIGWIVSWSPDGKKIAFDSFSEETNTQQIFIVDASSSADPYRLKGQDSTRHNGDPAWSPDGKQIVFTSKAKAVAEKPIE